MFRLVARRINSLLIISCFLTASTALADEPNLRREQQFHNIYRSFNQTPTKLESWHGVSHGKVRTYSVQKGDNLWDLSETLFGDSQFWPKIWSLNAEKIQNPHEIYPSQMIQFNPGTMGEAPSFAVADKTDAEEEPSTQLEDADEKANLELASKAEIPVAPVKPGVGKIPPSLPVWTYGAKIPKLKFEVTKLQRNFSAPEMNLNYYLDNQPSEFLGEVTETELGVGAAAEFQYVFVRLRTAPSEKNLMVVNQESIIRDPVTHSIGYLNVVQGEIEVLEMVNSKESIYRAIVKKSLHNIEVGSKLLNGPLPKFSTQKEVVGSASARIVGGQGESKSSLYTTQNLVFLAGTGFTLNVSYPIYKVQRTRAMTSAAVESPRKIGEVKVVRTSGIFATAVVLYSNEDLHVGDMTSPSLFIK